eukprot:m.24040 g.24040  ORF g.24040 m.24040 type:complete len:169 (+) comp14454_c0_seq1:173-679(+)
MDVYDPPEILSSDEKRSKVQQYEAFLNERLRKDLKIALENRDILFNDISEYSRLLGVIDTIKTSQSVLEDGALQTQVDLGCNFYCQAEVANPNMICVAIGFGFFLDLTLDEATTFINEKMPVLQARADVITDKASKIKANIKVVLEGLRELQNLDSLGQPKADTSRNF